MSEKGSESDFSDPRSLDEDDEDWSIKLEEDFYQDEEAAAELAQLVADRDASLDDILKRYGGPAVPPPTEFDRAAEETYSDVSSVSSSDLAKMLKWDNSECSDEDFDPEYEPTQPHSKPRIGAEYQADVDSLPCIKPVQDIACEPPVLFDFTVYDGYLVSDYLDEYRKILKERKNPIPCEDVTRALTVLSQFNCKPELALAHLKKEVDYLYPDNREYTDIQLRMYPFKPQPPWDEQEIAAFENGIKTYGKNFTKIRDEMLPYRSLGDLTNFYYQFKKTDRYKMLPKFVPPTVSKPAGYMTRSEVARNEEPVAGPSHAFGTTPFGTEAEGEDDADGVKVEAITTFKAFVASVNGETTVHEVAAHVQKVNKPGGAEELKAGENGDINPVHSVTDACDA